MDEPEYMQLPISLIPHEITQQYNLLPMVYNGKIYIKPTRALEYIFVEFLITPTGASFEDI